MDTISLMLHVTAAAVLVGPQVLMFLAVTPATWLVDDERLKRDLVRVVAGRFGMLAGASLVVLLLTGLYQFYFYVPEAIQENMMDYRFGIVFVVKMSLFTVLVLLIFAHMIFFSRRIARLSDAVLAGEADPGTLEYARMQSFLFSVLLLLVSIAVLWLGVALGDHEYARLPR
ncbi:MAG: hypothetical protein M0R73_07735 [Dehalococcoidia bacterium]|nr:hypothetical protein [Dehalococcoidia bacterium]